MSMDQQRLHEALALYQTTQAGLFRFWISKTMKAKAEEQFRAIVEASPELANQIEEYALEKGDVGLWLMLAEINEDNPDVALYATGIDSKHSAICDVASSGLLARLKDQSEFARNPSEDVMPMLNESRSPLARVTGPTEFLLMAIDNAVHRGETAYHFHVLLHALAYNSHVWGHRPYQERVGKSVGALCRGAAQLSISILKGDFGEQQAERYIGRWNLMRKHTREEAIASLSQVLQW